MDAIASNPEMAGAMMNRLMMASDTTRAVVAERIKSNIVMKSARPKGLSLLGRSRGFVNMPRQTGPVTLPVLAAAPTRATRHHRGGMTE